MKDSTNAPDAIAAMTPEQKQVLRIYGDHARACAWRRAMENVERTGAWTKLPDCDCGWLEALGAACGGEG